MKVFDVVDRKPWMAVLPTTWAFRTKRFTDGTVRKLKGRACCRGDLERPGIHHDPNNLWSPVVSWTTVQLMLILMAQLNLKSQQVNYTAAFVYANLEKPPNWDELTPLEQECWGIHLEIPQGFGEPGKVWKLKKSLYGLRAAPKLWSTHLAKKLARVGFEQMTEVDSCLFISPKVICLTYI